MRKMILGMAVAIAAFAAGAPAMAAEKMLIVVTSAEPEVQAMAMILGMEVRKKEHEVRILLCGPGGGLALKGAEMPALKPSGKTPQQMLQGLMAQGAKAEVCGLYLPNSGKTDDALIDGVTPVKPPVIGEYMVQPDVRYFTF